MKHINAVKTFTKGIIQAKAFVYQKKQLHASQDILQNDKEIENAIQRFEGAVQLVSNDLGILAEESEIFAGHLSIANDIALRESVINKIQESKQNTEMAVENSISELSNMMLTIDDPYMQERAVDIQDVGDRLLAALQGREIEGLEHLDHEVIIIAENLTPSDTAMMNFDYVKGFITEKGGVTSHLAIIAKSLALPALVGVDKILENVDSGDNILFDASSGDIYINPNPEVQKQLLEKAKRETLLKNEIEKRIDFPVVTEDGKKIKVYANVGSLEDIEQAMEYKIKGIGLFRTEFLFMNNTKFPDEEEQFQVYKSAIELLKHEIIIRTLDIGGDKSLPYFKFEAEENPFLGWRAIRISLDNEDIFKMQLKALLRAAVYGPIKIMIPMIISVEEIKKVKKLISDCQIELTAEKKEYAENIPLGIMIETPAAIMLAEDLAREVDFFSIGSNDLTQYMLAADRGNKKVEHLYDPYHPAVLRAIHQVIQAANKADIEVGMCGEFASDDNITELLLGFGLDEYSMVASETPLIKEKIRQYNYGSAVKLASQVLNCSTIMEVRQLLGITQD
ncbi:MAG TPA: phosphoenolpyruvate--protein phosphotransferase [Candidatus Eisenbacteria bacterium]|nr:phosphoenolpyruvate--protein phosphotransferase [Candidatus Eisenbacteria bacterium]